MNGNKLRVKGKGRGGGEKGVPRKSNIETCEGLRLECETHEGNWQEP